MRVVHDASRCASLGICEAVAPAFFEVRADGALHLLRDEAGEESRPELEEAVASCPTGALRVRG